jgi:hypothetical protein
VTKQLIILILGRGSFLVQITHQFHA